MKKIVNKLKQNAKIITAFVLGAILTGGTVYAATVLPSSQVGYDNSASGLAATDVQGALDELYTRANTWIDASKDYSSSHLKINLVSTEQIPIFAAAIKSAKSAQTGAKGYAGFYADSTLQSTWQA